MSGPAVLTTTTMRSVGRGTVAEPTNSTHTALGPDADPLVDPVQVEGLNEQAALNVVDPMTRKGVATGFDPR